MSLEKFFGSDESIQGIGAMAVASVFYFLMSSMVKLSVGIPTSQIVFFRAVIAMILCLVQLKMANVNPWGEHKKFLILRGIFGTLALVLFFYTLHHLPMAMAVTVQYLSPIFTTILTSLVLKEIFFKGQALFFLFSFMGVFFIQGASAVELTPLLLGVFGALFSACAYASIRKIQSLGGENPLVIIFYFPLVTIPVIAPKAYIDWIWPSTEQWAYLCLVGVFVQTAQYFMTRAYQLGEGSVVSIAGYLSVIWACLGGGFFFGEDLTIPSIVGILLILFGVVGNTLYRSYLLKSR